ncbi:crossover junction endodeoxyribonuclease RuvC [bacterium BMS3Abin15]|nr:crossover junction endodeoxyribonuclease RuvC [bacterium BMS3Abin15]HDH07617.1 crossover junction endodeoxyribonuclease RuvC [Candidatus Moranbacteria bacterium]HDZ85612.1 crossover junction endodeoxyribonuclease RuvC [Candidatus Moranbacteria bacterium]
MKTLGIDPGTATTGWAILEESLGKINSLAHGCICTPKEKSTAQRLKETSNDLKKIIKKYKPEEAAVEDIFFFKNLKTAVKVSQSRGAILLTLEELKVKIFEYTPLQVKQALTGYGRAEKRQIQIMTKEFLNLKSIPKPDDVADALATGICHINSRKINSLK